jgi:hypothetical protein
VVVVRRGAAVVVVAPGLVVAVGELIVPRALRAAVVEVEPGVGTPPALGLLEAVVAVGETAPPAAAAAAAEADAGAADRPEPAVTTRCGRFDPPATSPATAATSPRAASVAPATAANRRRFLS